MADLRSDTPPDASPAAADRAATVEPERTAPASVGQRLLWFLEHYRPDTNSLNCPVIFRLEGSVDRARLGAAVDRLVARHESLRTTLARRGRDLVQLVHAPAHVPVAEVPVASAHDAERLLADDLRATVDAGEVSMRATLWDLPGDEHLLCLNMHHLLADAWSGGLLAPELIELYAAGDERPPQLPEVAWQYADFAIWQAGQVASGAWRAHQDYWLAKLRGLEVPALPLRKAPADAGRAVAVDTADIAAEVRERLQQIAREERTTLFTVTLALYYVVLAEASGQGDLAVGSLFANRSRREVQGTVGFFANMVALRSDVAPQDSFRDVVRGARRTTADAFTHQCVPFQMLSMDARAASARADDVVFQMLPARIASGDTEVADVRFHLVVPEGLGTRFGVELSVLFQDDRLRALLSHTAGELDPSFASGLLERYVGLAAAVAADPDLRVGRA